MASRGWIFSLPVAMAALAMAIVLMLSVTTPAVQAQTYTVLHNFAGQSDGSHPWGGLTIDTGGNLYGTTYEGNPSGDNAGGVFKLTRRGSSYTFSTLHNFTWSPDGASPLAALTIGPNGTLYGTTQSGGIQGCQGYGCGTVFNVGPPPTPCKAVLCPWRETTLYSFTGGNDGAQSNGNVVFDQAGNLYGTTYGGGATGNGVVFEMTPSHGGWIESVLYSFGGGSDGAAPYTGVIFDPAGNLYGTTAYGGQHFAGTVFKLTPSGSGWTESILYTFQGGSDGGLPQGGLVFDSSGNLYGTALTYGANDSGTVFELSPSINGTWTFNLVHSFSGNDGANPLGNLIFDVAGNLYGTTYHGGTGCDGTAYKLTPSDGVWIESILHCFPDYADGSNPSGGMIFDANGNLYGSTSYGGTGYACSLGCGVVFEITP